MYKFTMQRDNIQVEHIIKGDHLALSELLEEITFFLRGCGFYVVDIEHIRHEN